MRITRHSSLLRNLATAATQNPTGAVESLPFLCLERSIGDRNGADRALWETGAFDAEVYPDLPFAATWTELMEKTIAAFYSSDSNLKPRASAPSPAQSAPSTGVNAAITVRTVGAQCSSRSDLQDKMQLACSPVSEGGGGAKALLFVSGSHPARAIPFADNLLESSFSMLQDAKQMRSAGELPPETALWAVENPLINPPERLLRKVEAGAETVLTQPPFLEATSAQWFETAKRLGAADTVKIIAGIPMATSIGNLNFWLRLCSLGGTEAAVEVVRNFPQSNGKNKEEYALEVRKWNENFIRRVLSLPGVSGLHIMPLTKQGREMTVDFLKSGIIPSRLTLS